MWSSEALFPYTQCSSTLFSAFLSYSSSAIYARLFCLRLSSSLLSSCLPSSDCLLLRPRSLDQSPAVSHGLDARDLGSRTACAVSPAPDHGRTHHKPFAQPAVLSRADWGQRAPGRHRSRPTGKHQHQRKFPRQHERVVKARKGSLSMAGQKTGSTFSRPAYLRE